MTLKQSLFLFIFLIKYHPCTHSHISYDVLIPTLTSVINPETKTSQQEIFINLCTALHQHGTKTNIVHDENWQTIISTKMFHTILPKIARTTTLSGYAALAQMITLFSDDPIKLQKNIALQQYFSQNFHVIKELTNILSYGIKAEAAFAHTFRTLTEEEIELNTTTNSQIYFSKFGLKRYNESSLLLGIGPRLNQCITCVAIIIPIIIASCIHKSIPLYADIQTKIELINKDDLRIKESIQIKDYGIDYAGKKAIHQKFCQQHNIDIKKTAQDYENERIQKISDVYNDQPKYLNFPEIQKNKSLPSKYALMILYDGLKNLPQFTYDVINQAPNEINYFISKNIINVARTKALQNPKDSLAFLKSCASTSIRYIPFMYIAGLYPWIAYNRIKSTKHLMDIVYEKNQEIAKIAQLIQTLQTLRTTIKKNETLHNLLKSEQKHLKNLLNPDTTSISTDLKYLIHNLKYWPNEQKTSYCFSNIGKILAIHHLLMRTKSELVPYLETFGQIDAYLSIAKLYQECKQNAHAQYCIPTFIQNKTPILHAQEYWHPLVACNQVITNSIQMNFPQTSNIIITGPNAGGKTTSLMSLVLNIIFAQSLGIAPSQSLTLTPFTKVHSCLDTTTNLQEGLSLFEAQADRAKKLKISITACLPEQKSFTIIDEIFSGTDPKIAAEAGTKFAIQLAEFTNSMTIITTHFSELTNLESSTGRFTNFKVADAVIANNGTIHYPYKLIPGISSQNIAMQMLINQGIL